MYFNYSFVFIFRYNVVHPGIEQNRLILCQSPVYPYFVPSVPLLPYTYPVLVPSSIESVPSGPYSLQTVVPSYTFSPDSHVNPFHNNSDKQVKLSSSDGKTPFQSKPKQEPDKHIPRGSVRCSCEKTRCLKLYCDCLKAGKECGIFCSCKDCLNKAEYKEREYALEFLKKRNGNVPGSTSDNSSNTTAVVCTCQRSQCCKKYCSCYLKGVKCTSACSCVNCKNK